MGDDSQGGLSDFWILLMQVLIEILVIRLNDVREAMKEVSHCNDDVIFDYGVDAAIVEKLDDMRELLFAEI